MNRQGTDSRETQENDSQALNTLRVSGGWVKVYRKIMDSAFYRKSAYVHLWLHLLLRAGYDEKKVMLDGTATTLLPGQFVTGRKALEKETGIPGSTVERILAFFESEHQIGQLKTHRFRLITIQNWNEYQESGQLNGQLMDTNKNIRILEEKDNKGFRSHEISPLPLSWPQYKESIEENEAVWSIDHFLLKYKKERGEDHPPLSPEQWEDALNKMTFIFGNESFPDTEDIDHEENARMVDHYFTRRYQDDCDYRLAHFLSEGVRRNLFFEACYRGPDCTR